MASQFSQDGKYFAQFSTEGKLKIWETASSSLQQEFTPDFHLTTPCTCLHFVDLECAKVGSPRKKLKRKNSLSNSLRSSAVISLGTTNGCLFVYSIAKAELDFTIDSKTNQSVNCISWAEGDCLFSGVDQHIICWNLEKRSIKSKWKGGNEKITAILALAENTKVITASKNIKLWDVDKKEVLKTLTGHSYEVSLLKYINQNGNSGQYLISGSKGDRILSCWNINEKQREINSVANFLMEDIPLNVSVYTKNDNSTCMAVTIRSGVVHIYQHTLNGKSPKPLKPKTTVQIASSDTGQSNTVTPIPIFGASFNEDMSLLIVHGSVFLLTFENITLTDYQKVHCLIRKDPRLVQTSKENQNTNVKTPLVGENVCYLTPRNLNSTTKRKNGGDTKVEIPMEKRLENLMLGKADKDTTVPKMDNLTQLLIQGIHSKDKNILKNVLHKRDETVIRNTVKRLPITVIDDLVKELTAYIQGKTIMSQIGAQWLKVVLQMHAGILLSKPNLIELLGPTLGSIESRILLQAPLNRLKGRLDLIVSQVNTVEKEQSFEPVFDFNDKDQSDTDNDMVEMATQSESDNNWEEESSDEERNANIEENSDVEMST